MPKQCHQLVLFGTAPSCVGVRRPAAMSARLRWTVIPVRIPDPDSRLDHCLSHSPSVVPYDSDLPLLLCAKAKLGGGEQAVGNKQIAVDAVIDELRLTIRADDE